MENKDNKYNLEFLVFEILAGQNEYQIAKNTGLPIKKIKNILESEKFQILYNSVLESIKKRIDDKLDIVYDKAINKLNELLDSTKEENILEAIKIIFNSKSKIPSTAIQINNTPQDNKTNSLVKLIIENREKRGLKE